MSRPRSNPTLNSSEDEIDMYLKRAGYCEKCTDPFTWHIVGKGCEMCDQIGGPCKNRKYEREHLPYRGRVNSKGVER